MEQVMEWSLFARYTIQQYLPLIKDLSVEELRQLISILITPTLKSGWRSVNQKEMSTDSLLTYTSALWSVTSLCEDLNREIKKLDVNGENYSKNVKQLESLIYYLREIQTRITQKHISIMDLRFT